MSILLHLSLYTKLQRDSFAMLFDYEFSWTFLRQLCSFRDCRTSSCSSYQVFSAVKRCEWSARFEENKVEAIHFQVFFSFLFYLSLICMFRCWRFVFVDCRCTRCCRLLVLVYTLEMQESRRDAKNIRTSLLLRYWET